MLSKQPNVRKPPLSGEWFWFPTSILLDPKVQRLPAHLFKTWINLLCLAGGFGGPLPSGPDMAGRLRLTREETDAQIDELVSRDLLTVAPDGRFVATGRGRRP